MKHPQKVKVPTVKPRNKALNNALVCSKCGVHTNKKKKKPSPGSKEWLQDELFGQVGD